MTPPRPAPVLPVVKTWAILLFLALVLWLPGCGGSADEQVQAIYHLVQARKAYTKGDYTQAEREYEQYLLKAPEGQYSWESWNRRVNIWLTVHNNSTQAVELLGEMALEYGETPRALLEILPRLAGAHAMAGEAPQAVEVWKRYLALPSLDAVNATDAWLRLASLSQEFGAYDQSLEALRHCKETAGASPRRHFCRYEEGRTLLLKKLGNETMPLLEELIAEKDIDPELNATAAYLLAELYRTENQPEYLEKARKLLEAVQETYPNPIVVRNRLKKLEQASK